MHNNAPNLETLIWYEQLYNWACILRVPLLIMCGNARES